MKPITSFFIAAFILFAANQLSAQRFLSEVFTDNQVVKHIVIVFLLTRTDKLPTCL
jgi:hypothetical protein